MTEQDDVSVAGGLRRSGVRSAGTAVAAGVLEQLLSVVTTVVLVRILDPADFGLIAAATVVIGLVTVFVHLGLGPAVLRRGSDQGALSTLFWLTVLLAAALTALLAAAAVPLAAAVGEPDAAPFIPALGACLAVRLLSTVPRGILYRDLRFGAVFRADVAAAIAYAALQIVVAAAGGGAWSIVVGQLASAIVLVVLLTAASGWRPSRIFRRDVVRAEAGFSAGVTTNLGVAWVAKNADYWLVAHLAGARTLGVYYIAYVLPNVVRMRLTSASTEVMLPLLNKVLGDPPRLRRGYLISLRAHLVVGLPSMTGIAILADPLIEVFFGTEWRGATDPLRILAIGAALEFATQAGSNVHLALATPMRSVAIQVVRVVVLGSLLATVYVVGFELTRVAWAVLVATLVAAITSLELVRRQLTLEVGDLVRVSLPLLVATAVMAGTLQALLAGPLHRLADLLVIVVLVPIGAGVYAGLLALLDRAALRELVRDLRSAVGRSPASEQLDVAE